MRISMIAVALCLVVTTAGCSTVGSAGKAIGNELGMYDYPKPYKKNVQVSGKESWRGIFSVKPAAEEVVKQAVDLARQRSRPGQEENNEFLALAKLDRNRDRVITASEADESAGEIVGEVADALGNELRIDDGSKPVINTGGGSDSATAKSSK